MTPNEPTFSEHRIALTIAGMHRSGTSALAGSLIHLGAEGPRTPFSDHWNAKGHFESLPVIAVSNAILHSAGLEVEDWGARPDEWPGPGLADRFAGQFAEAVSSEFTGELIVVKDPRICRFAGLAAEGLTRAGWEPRFALIFRDPYEVAQSLGRRNGLPLEHNLLIWLRSVLDAEKDTRHYRRHFLSYEALIQDWRGAIGRLEQDLGVVLPRRSTRAEMEVDSFLEADLRHFKDTTSIRGTALQDWLQTACEAHVTLARSASDSVAIAALDGIAQALTLASARFHGLFCKLAQPHPPAAAESPNPQLATTITSMLDSMQHKNEQLLSQVSALVEQQVEALRQVAGTLAVVPRQMAADQSHRLRVQEELLGDKIALLRDRLSAREGVIAAGMDRVARAEATVESLQLLQHDYERRLSDQAARAETALAEVRHLREEAAANWRAIGLSGQETAFFARALPAKWTLLKLLLSGAAARRERILAEMRRHHVDAELQQHILPWLCRRRIIFGLLRRTRGGSEALIKLEILQARTAAQEAVWERLARSEEGAVA